MNAARNFCLVVLGGAWFAAGVCGTDEDTATIELHVKQRKPSTVDFYVVNNTTNTIIIAGPDAMMKGAGDQTYWLSATDAEGNIVKPLLNASFMKARSKVPVEEKVDLSQFHQMTDEEVEKARSMSREEFERLVRANPGSMWSGAIPPHEVAHRLHGNMKTPYMPVELKRWFNFRAGDKYVVRVHLQIIEKAKVIESSPLEVTAEVPAK